MELSKIQLRKIDSYIDSLQIKQLDIRLELQDHIASIIENKMIEDEDELKMSYIHYEITDLVRELKYEIRRESIRELFQVFKWNLSFPNIFIVLFISAIAFSAFMNLGFIGAPIVEAYSIFTIASLFVYFRKTHFGNYNNSYKVEKMIENSWLPLITIGAIGLVFSLGAQVIYTKFYLGGSECYVGSIVASLCFGMLIKTIYDTFVTIPSIIREEISLEDLTRRLSIC